MSSRVTFLFFFGLSFASHITFQNHQQEALEPQNIFQIYLLSYSIMPCSSLLSLPRVLGELFSYMAFVMLHR